MTTSAPADADLLFEIQFSIPSVEQRLDVEKTSSVCGVLFDPQFQLSIRDAKTKAFAVAHDRTHPVGHIARQSR